MAGLPVRTVREAIDAAAKEWPDNGFTFQDLKGAETFYSYAGIRRETARRAAALQDRGLVKGDRVIVCFSEPKDFVLTFLAAVRLGLLAVPISQPPLYADQKAYLERIMRVTAKAQPRALVTESALVERFNDLVGPANGIEQLIAAESLTTTSEVEGVAIAPDDVAFLQFTSGSTQEPRGVTVTHRMLIANTIGIMGASGLQSDPAKDRGVSWLPLYHDMGLIGFVIAPLCWGASTVLIPTSRFLRNPSVWLDAINRHRASTSWGQNFSFALAARRAGTKDLNSWDLSCVKVIGCGGEPINPGVMRDFNDKFCAATGLPQNAIRPSYGLAEATLSVSLTPLADGMITETVDAEIFEREGRVEQPRPGRRVAEHVCAGRVIANHALRIAGADGSALPEGHEGEIQFAGPSVTPGYFRDADASAGLLQDRWLRTGDLGYVLHDRLYVTGRLKDLIVVNGLNIAPQAVEWSAARVDGVRAANVAAFSVPGAETERIVVVIEIHGQDSANIALQIRSQLLADLALPVADIVCVQRGQIPKTSSGKIQRVRTRQMYLQNEFTLL
jgi:fatty-acyl-CoA synthase